MEIFIPRIPAKIAIYFENENENEKFATIKYCWNMLDEVVHIHM